MQEISLATGAGMRVTRPGAETMVLCINGGGARPRPGNWSPTIEWLVDRLAPVFPDAGFAEVRYRVRSWKMLPSCIADGQAALAALPGARRVVMLGFSMGGAVSIACAGDERIGDVVGLISEIAGKTNLLALNATIEAARGNLRESFGVLWAAAQAGESAPMAARARVRRAVVHAAEASTEAVNLCYRTAGGSALFASGPFEAALRDVNAMCCHLVFQRAMMEDAGRVALGQAPTLAVF